MTIYHVETQEDYDALMVELEAEGYKWADGEMPTEQSYFDKYGSETTVTADASIFGKFIQYCDVAYEIEDRPNEPIIEYKAKGENMTQENMTQEEMKQKEMKQKEMKLNIFDLARDVSVAVESVARDIKFEMKKSTVEADLQEAKSSAKKMIEKIDEYLESLKPKFEVGDYVTVDVNGRIIIAKIDELSEKKTEAHGIWYDKTKVNVKQDYWFLAEGSKFRHARPSEIAEYESALTFHKHGRKPFEVKDGDLLENKFGKFIAYKSLISKEGFTVGGNTLLKTAEEVSEWLENK